MDTLEPGSLPHERLARRVRGEAEKWRAWSAGVDAAEQRLIAEGWPASAMWNALVFAEANRLSWCGELLTVFGVDIETVKRVQEPTCYDNDRYTITAMCAVFWHSTSRALWKHYARTVRSGEPLAPAVCGAYITAMRCKPVVANILMEQSPLPRWREEGALTTSGWAGSELSLYRNRRLAASLAWGGTSPWDALWIELPGATVQACSDLPPEKRGPKELRNHIA